MKKEYQSPAVVEFGSVSELTAALGAQVRPDQSEFPSIPAGLGSFDICDNDDTMGVC